MSSNEIDPIRSPAPNAITMAMSFGLGVATYAISAPTRSADAPIAPQKNASNMVHLWAIPLRDAVRDAGGIVLSHNTLTPEDLVVFGMDVGRRARRSRRRELNAAFAAGR